MTLRIGSMFSGYGGLDLAVKEAIGGETAFVADICGNGKHKKKCGAPCTILAHRFPDAPNLGDVTKINWSEWAGKIDVLTAGFPCQDLSTAGLRAGLTGARSGLWSEVVRAIVELKPKLVVLENVQGIYTAHATGNVEPCAWCVGDDTNGDMRALDAVLADLAEIGFDAEWISVRASDIGAPHRRERWFCIAYPQSDQQREPFIVVGKRPEFTRGAAKAHLKLLPTLLAAKSYGEGSRSSEGFAPNLGQVVNLLPTPRTSDTNGAGVHGTGGPDLRTVISLLPTPTARDHKDNQIRREPHRPDSVDTLSRALVDFGDYGPAIEQWERVLGRHSPSPTITGKSGKPRLNPAFAEWMMGLPAGWVTDVPGVTGNEALKACGNGVVPQQAAYAISHLLERAEVLA